MKPYTVMRAKRERLGISQAELARHLGVSQARVSVWENRRAPMPPARAEEIARFLGLSGRELLLLDALDLLGSL